MMAKLWRGLTPKALKFLDRHCRILAICCPECRHVLDEKQDSEIYASVEGPFGTEAGSLRLYKLNYGPIAKEIIQATTVPGFFTWLEIEGERRFEWEQEDM